MPHLLFEGTRKKGLQLSCRWRTTHLSVNGVHVGAYKIRKSGVDEKIYSKKGIGKLETVIKRNNAGVSQNRGILKEIISNMMVFSPKA